MDRSPEALMAEIYTAQASRLIGLLRVMGAAPADAEEIVHDTFVRLWERWGQVRDHPDVAAWLRTAAVRRFISRQRRLAVARRALPRLAAGTSVIAPAPNADAVDLGAALESLPRTQRVVLVLFYVHDLAIADIAETLRISQGTVKSRLSRGRTAIAPLLIEREAIEPDYPRISNGQ